MVYSHTQISHYLRSPRSYRYRYLDGWREKDIRAGMAFGRCFETSLISSARTALPCCSANGRCIGKRHSNIAKVNPGITCSTKVSICCTDLHRMAGSESRILLKTWPIKLNRTLLGNNQFVSYIGAIGELDGQRCLIDWKTTTRRYIEDPDGLLSLNPQLVCYSCISGIPDMAFVVFVREHLPEIQYLKARISDETAAGFWVAG